MKGFMFKQQPKTSMMPFDRYCSIILQKAIARHARLARQKNLKAWAKAFMLLREVDEADTDRILDVLEWYAKNCGKKYTPQAYSGPTFRAKFIAIEAAMQRDRLANPDVKITAEAKKIVERLWRLNWPKDSAKRLPVHVQKGLNDYREFRHKLYELYEALFDERGAPKKRKFTFKHVNHIWYHLPTPDVMIEQWFRDAHAQVHGWTGWSGDWSPFAFDVHHTKFQRQCATVMTEYTTATGAWEAIMEELYGSD